MYQESASEPVLYTIIAGVAIYVLGQIIQNFILKPLQDFNITKVDISHKIKFWSNVLNNPDVNREKTQQATLDMRDLSSNLESRYIIIPFKKSLSFLGLLPNQKNVREAAKQLIFLSNTSIQPGTHSDEHNAIEKIKQALNLVL